MLSQGRARRGEDEEAARATRAPAAKAVGEMGCAQSKTPQADVSAGMPPTAQPQSQTESALMSVIERELLHPEADDTDMKVSLLRYLEEEGEGMP